MPSKLSQETLRTSTVISVYSFYIPPTARIPHIHSCQFLPPFCNPDYMANNMSEAITPVTADSEVTTVQSLCMNCHEQGTTRLLLCQIPFFKEIVVSSFECTECGFANNDVQSVGSLSEHGVHFEFTVRTPRHLNRDIVKSEYATLTIPSIGFEIPPSASKALYTNVEGVLTRAAEDLEAGQPQRAESDPEVAAKVAAVIGRLKAMSSGEELPFVIVLDDPAGNSHITHDIAQYMALDQDPDLSMRRYARTREQLFEMGYSADDLPAQFEQMAISEEPEIVAHNVDFSQPLSEDQAVKEGPIEFTVECFSCRGSGKTTMCLTHVPHFKEIVVMGFRCELCGAKSTEVKGGGAISPRGSIVTLRVLNQTDLRRDVIKSDTAVVRIPEIGLELVAGTLGGLITTVEGLVDRIEEEVLCHAPEALGDSLTPAESQKFREFKTKIADYKSTVSEPYTLILDDPLANSYVGKLGDDDPQVTQAEYDRTPEQNDDLGLTDMRV